jgi:hypothetical protein
VILVGAPRTYRHTVVTDNDLDGPATPATLGTARQHHRAGHGTPRIPIVGPVAITKTSGHRYLPMSTTSLAGCPGMPPTHSSVRIDHPSPCATASQRWGMATVLARQQHPLAPRRRRANHGQRHAITGRRRRPPACVSRLVSKPTDPFSPEARTNQPHQAIPDGLASGPEALLEAHRSAYATRSKMPTSAP